MKKLMLCAILFLGCTSKNFYDSTIGSATTVGVVLPTENLVNFEVLNTLDGCKIKIKEPCCIVHHFTMTNNTTWFKFVETSSTANSFIQLCPTNAVHSSAP